MENLVEVSVCSVGNFGFQIWVVVDVCFIFVKFDFYGILCSVDEVYVMVLVNLYGEYVVVLCVVELLQCLLV